MSYSVYVADAARRDLNKAADYIELTLKNPKAADDLLTEAEKQIGSLSECPKRYKLVDDPVLASWGIRFVIVKGYLAFYTVSEESNLVMIIRFLFRRSNWKAILGGTDL